MAVLRQAARRGPRFLPDATGKARNQAVVGNRLLWHELMRLSPALSFKKTDVEDAFYKVLYAVE